MSQVMQVLSTNWESHVAIIDTNPYCVVSFLYTASKLLASVEDLKRKRWHQLF